ncbi:MAG: redoxin [Betaproteobacteria bacterium HGW-Betaproteobacteria-22]|nr:MAG: redoxin [Betaproteobacteria bacterium HGW-Betaproteobacteria-22]
MLKKLRKPLIYITVLIGLVLIIRSLPLGQPPAKNSTHTESSSFYATQLVDSNDMTQDLKQYQGKIVVVNFWATWCPPCREEMPELSAFHDAYQDKNVTVLGIAVDDPAAVKEFLAATPVSYPVLIGEMEANALGDRLGNDKGILPYTVILNADGTIVSTHFGRVDGKLLAQSIAPVLHKALPLD